jgi:uncharacterized protein (DUF433 family)
MVAGTRGRDARWFSETRGLERTRNLPRAVIYSYATFPDMDWRSRITIEPGKRGGKPCIRGLRMTVYDILEYLASGMSEDEILGDFPDLEREDILAALAFAAERERKVVRPSAA